MGGAVTLAAVEAGFRELADAIGALTEKPNSLTARTMLGDAITKVTTMAASAVKGLDAALARERDLIARLQAAEARYQASEANLAVERVTRVAAQESVVAGEEAMAEMKLRLAKLQASPTAVLPDDLVDVVANAHMTALGYAENEAARAEMVPHYRRDAERMIAEITKRGFSIFSTSAFDVVPKPGVVPA